MRRKAAFLRAIDEEDRTVSAALEEYEQYLVDKGNKPSGIQVTMHRLRGFFEDVDASPMTRMTPQQAQAL